MDKYISLRLLNYILLFYQDLIKQKKVGKKLPFVLPIMLYSGEQKWKYPTELGELIQSPFDFLEEFVPSFKYLKISEIDFSNEELNNLDSFLAKFFNLNNLIKNNGDLYMIVESIKKFLINSPDNLKQEFDAYFNCLFINKDIKLEGELLKGGDDMNFFERFDRLLDKTLQEKKNEGIQEGIQKGEKRGLLKTAKAMLKDGLQLDRIKKITGLSDKDLKDLVTSGVK